MNIRVHQTNIRTIRQNDDRWLLKDGITICPRAGFEIDQRCPREYRMIISECIDLGWLKPVANVYDYETVYEKLKYD